MADLNLSNFTNVFDDDFTKDKSLNTSLWSSHWGSPGQYWFSGANGLLIAGTHATGWTPVGIEQNPSGPSAGEGYGLFQFTGKAAVAGQGVGICFVMWRADNVWLDKTNPGLLTELDILESWDKTTTGQATDHYYNTATNENGQVFHTVQTDLTQFHTYSMDWEAGSLTYYVDGKELYQITGATVPKDYAHGGVNYTMGAEVTNEASFETTPTVGLYIKDMSYSTSNNGVTAPPVAPVAPVVPVPPVVPPVVAATITLPGLGTVQETSVGAGVTVVEKIATTGVKTLYAEVLTKAGAVETAYRAVTLDASGNGIFTALLAHSGDSIKAVDSLTAATVTSTSGAVTITDPPVIAPPVIAPPVIVPPVVTPVITVVQPASLTVGEDIFTGSVTGSPTSVELAWHTSGVETNGAADFVKATVNADGSFTAKLAVDHAGVASSLWTDVDGVVSKAFTATPAAISVPPVVIVPPVIIPVSPSSMFLISSLTEDGGRMLLTGDKEIGGKATMREFMDGKYVGVVRDAMADGGFSMHLADVTSGAHVLKLTLDGSSSTAVYDFTKQSGGSIVPAASASSAASHAIVVSTTHDQLVQAA